LPTVRIRPALDLREIVRSRLGHAARSARAESFGAILVDEPLDVDELRQTVLRLGGSPLAP
jgi:hypothetical protein